MKWNIPQETVLYGGEERVRRQFAWKPAKVGKQMVWLEHYEIEERFFAPASGNPGWWKEISRQALDWYY